MFKVKITWENTNVISESVRIYRSDTVFDEDSLPPILEEILDPNVFEYEDLDVEEGQTWFYMLSTKLGTLEAFSDCYQVDVEGVFDPSSFMGIWITSAHAKGTLANRQLDPAATSQPTWAEKFGNTIGFVLNNYHYTEASLVNSGYNEAYHTINKKVNNLLFNVAANTNAAGGYVEADIRFKDASFSDIFVLSIKRRTLGGLEVYVGESISTLQQCPYVGSEPSLRGHLAFKDNSINFTPLTNDNNILGFSFPIPNLNSIENVDIENCFVINPATNTGSIIYLTLECVGAA